MTLPKKDQVAYFIFTFLGLTALIVVDNITLLGICKKCYLFVFTNETGYHGVQLESFELSF